MFCRNGAVPFGDEVVNNLVDGFLVLFEKVSIALRLGALYVVVQVAIAEVAEADDAASREGCSQRGLALVDKIGNG